METTENYSCVDCIWHDQCESYDIREICDFFDRGTDYEIETQIEKGRTEFYSEYQKYINNFGGEKNDR